MKRKLFLLLFLVLLAVSLASSYDDGSVCTQCNSGQDCQLGSTTGGVYSHYSPALDDAFAHLSPENNAYGYTSADDSKIRDGTFSNDYQATVYWYNCVTTCTTNSWRDTNNYRCSGNTRQIQQTRTVYPSGCDYTSRWVDVQNCANTGQVCSGSACMTPCTTTSWVDTTNYRCEGDIRQIQQTRTVSPAYCAETTWWPHRLCSSGQVCNQTIPSTSLTSSNSCCTLVWTNTTQYRCSGSSSQIRQVSSNCAPLREQWITVENCLTTTGNPCLVETGRCSTIDTTYWANLYTGQRITNLSLGGTALMVVGGKGLDTMQINFTIKKESSGLLTNFLGFFGVPKPWTSLAVLSGNRTQLTTPLTDAGNYLFNATIVNTTIKKSSEILVVSNSVDNFNPVANITYPTKSITPSNFLNFSVGQLIQFNQSSYDGDDLLNLTWNFGDGNSTSIGGYYALSNSGNIIHSYINGSKFYTVTLTAKEMTRTQSDSDSVNFYVFGKGINIVPIISSPAYDSLAGYQVMYNASLSYIVNCSDNMPISNFSVGVGASKLNCIYLLAPKATDSVKGTVRIRWKEVDSNNNLIRWMRGNDTDGVIWNSTNYGIIDSDTTNLNGVVVFPYSYTERQFRRVRMEMSYDP